MATYVNDLRLKEIATGDESGTWGASTNTNLELIAEAFSFGTEAITTNADTHTTTIADGSTDPGRSIFLKYTGTLDSTCTITIGPNTVSKLWLIENATSGGFSIIIKQGSGATVTIANGQTKAIYSDGAGSGGAMVDAFQDLSIPDLFIDDDLTFTSDSAVITFGADGDTTLTHTDGSGLTLNSTNKLMFNDASQFIQGSSATVLSLGATDEIDLTATAIDVNGTMDVSGAVTANAGISIDNITIDGTEIDLSSGDLTIDVAGDIVLDADGGDVNFKDAGTEYLRITNATNGPEIFSTSSDGDLFFKGNDGGSTITALTLDMSAAGAATFNKGVSLGGDLTFTEDDGVEILARQSLTVTIDSDDDNTGRIFQVRSGASGSYEALAFFSEDVGAVFNEDSLAALDFRVESDGNTHMLFVDSGNNEVGIGTSDPRSPLHVQTSHTSTDVTAANTNSTLSIGNSGSGDGVYNSIKFAGNQQDMYIMSVNDSTQADRRLGFFVGSVAGDATTDERLSINGLGSVGIGTTNGDVTNDGTAARTYVGIIGTANRGRLNLGCTASNGADAGTLAFTNGTNSLAELVVDTHSGVQNAGDFTLDVTGDIVFDADGGDFNFKDGGTTLLSLSNAGSNNVQLSTSISDGDLIFKGNDGGSIITALTLDMSNAGAANFGSSIITPASGVIESASSTGSVTISGGATNKGGQILLRGGNGDSDIVFKSQASTATPQEVARIGPSEMVVNEGSVDYDFRVETNGNTATFFVDGGNDNIVMGSTSNAISSTNGGSAYGGATAPQLAIKQNAGTFGQLVLMNGNGGGANAPVLAFSHLNAAGAYTYGGSISLSANDVTAGAEDMHLVFSTQKNGAAATESFRLNEIGAVFNEQSISTNDFRVESDSHTNMLTVSASGDCVGINNNGTSARLTVTQTSASNITTYLFNNASTIASSSASILYIQTTGDSAIQDGYKIVTFADADTVIGTISSAASSTNVAYNTSSDERLKENIVDMEPQLDKVLAAKPRQFDWKKNGVTSQGFIAQELHEVFPEAVTVGGEDPTESPWSVDYGRVTPFLMKAIQEQQEQIEELKAEIAKLKGE